MCPWQATWRAASGVGPEGERRDAVHGCTDFCNVAAEGQQESAQRASEPLI